nr:gliding motility-associated C-terminal domain-containing protein [Saprospiraceae bacterium]
MKFYPIFSLLILCLGILYPFITIGQTTLTQGDVAVIGVNANANCPQFGFASGADIVHIAFLVDFESGSDIKVTDNAYQRLAANPGQWGNNEGITRLTYNGAATIPAGTVVTFKWPSGYEVLEPPAYNDWSFTDVDGSNIMFLNIAVAGDQLYIMQGPTWNNGTPSNHNATYDGNVLYGYNTKSEWIDFSHDNGDSGLHPDVQPCHYYNTDGGVEPYSSYSGPSDPTTRENWIGRITDHGNWTDWGSCPAYQYPIDFLEIINFEFEGIPVEICAADDPIDLGTSHSGVEGNWSGTGVSSNQFNPSGLLGVYTLTFTPIYDCLDAETFEIEVIDDIIPEFTITDAYCEGDTPDDLPLVSDNGIEGNWSPSIISTSESANYIFTPDPDQCASDYVLEVTISDNIDPEFSITTFYCEGDDPDLLPTTSDNGVEGSWSPSTISTNESADYVFTPDPNECATSYTLEVIIGDNLIPEFNIEDTYCEGDDPEDLPSFSDNGVQGSWFPDVIDTNESDEYEFIPDPGQCAENFILVVTINPTEIPEFSIEDFYCLGDTPEDLPATSDNGIEGTWSPTTISTSESGTYEFSPDTGQCAENFILEVTVEEIISPTFDINDEYCEGDIPDELPTVSDNGVEGSWDPSVISTTVSGTYEFFPDSGQCAENFTIEVTINESLVPVFDIEDEYCEGDTPDELPTVSVNGVSGSWSPSVISTIESALYEFTPDSSCAQIYSLDVTVHSTPLAEASNTGPYCEEEAIELNASGGAEFEWSGPNNFSSSDQNTIIPNGSVFNAGLYTVVVTDSNGCIDSAETDVVIHALPNGEMESNSPVCNGEDIELMGSGGDEYNWSGPNNFSSSDQNPTITNAGTLEEGDYFVTITDGNDCSVELSVFVEVLDLPQITITEVSCDSTLSNYLVEFNTDADVIDISGGVLTPLGGDNYQISGIEVGEDLLIELLNSSTGCDSEFEVLSPNCDCPFIEAPVSGGDQEICEGEDFPELTATTDPDYQINWYDQSTGGLLLEENNNNYLPPAPGTYYAEAFDPLTECTSTQRTPVSLLVNNNPDIQLLSVVCAPDLETYTVVIETNGDQINSSGGIILEISPGNYEISYISVDDDLTLEVVISATGCEEVLLVNAPNCDCPHIDPPESGGNVEICEGEPIPFLQVAVPGSLQANWYDSPVGGILLEENSEEYQPLETGFFYAAAFDPDSECESAERTEIIFVINALPELTVISQSCSADEQFYSIFFESDATNISSSLGVVNYLGGNEFEIVDIPVNNDVLVELLNILTDCGNEENITYTADCGAADCDDLDPPEVVGDSLFAVCPGTDFPIFEVQVEEGITVNWYDMAEGGDLLLENSTTFNPTEAGNYYAEAVDTLLNCGSEERTAFTLTVLSLPEVFDFIFICDEATETYGINIFTNAVRILSPLGVVMNLGDSIWEMTGIPNDSLLTLILVNPDIIGGCRDTLIFDAPNCDCPEIDPPVIVGSYSICEGDTEIPELVVEVDSGLTVNWYSEPIGGDLLLANGTTYIPDSAGIYYAEAIDTLTDCVSNSRTAVEIEVIPLPTAEIVTTDCEDNEEVYFATFMTDGNPANFWLTAGGIGVVILNPDGSLTVSDIPIGQNVTLIVINTATGCENEYLIESPDCGCPELDPIEDEIACEYFVLPEIEGTDLTGNEAYFDQPGGGGNTYLPGDTLMEGGLYYAYIQEGNCEIEVFFEVLINPLPQFDPISDIIACEFFPISDLEASGTHVESGDLLVYTEPNGGGNLFGIQDSISVSGTYYAWTGTVDCFDEEPFFVEIVEPASFVLDSAVCTEDQQTYVVFFTTDAAEINSSHGVIEDLGEQRMRISEIPIGMDLELLLTTTDEICSEVVEIESPVCDCPDIENPFDFMEFNFCEGDMIPVIELDVEDGFLVNWYDAPDGGNLIAESEVLFNPPGPGTYYFETVLEGTDCSSDDRGEVVVVERLLPTIQEMDIICTGTEFIEAVFVVNADEVQVTGADFDFESDTLRVFNVDPSGSVSVILDNEFCSQNFNWVLAPDICECIPAVNLLVADPSCPDIQNGSIEIFEVLDLPLPFTVELNGEFIDSVHQLPFMVENLTSGIYDLYLSGSGCEYFETVLLEDEIIPFVEIEPADVMVLQGSEVNLSVNTNLDPFIVDWSPEDLTQCENCPEISIVAEEDLEVLVRVTDEKGCTATANINIVTFSEIVVYMPNAFSPNTDGINDVFRPYFPPDFSGKVVEFYIYNRWGDRVFHRSDLSAHDELLGWDGTFNGEALNPAVFVYFIEIEDEAGEVLINQGEVQLVR